MATIVNKILAIGTVGTQIFIVLLIVYFLFFCKKEDFISSFLSKNWLKLAFAVTVIATSGSLFYSEFAGFSPCKLCWFQRIFMYPQAILLGVALIKKESKIIDYILPFSVIGLTISIYHNYIFYNAISSAVCDIGESCVTQYVLEFGYITIPMMSLTAFLLIAVLAFSKKYLDKN